MSVRVLGTAPEKLGNPQSLDNTSSAATNASGAPNAIQRPAGIATSTESTSTSLQQRQQPTDRGTIFPISALSPFQNKWTVKARVTQKSEIKQWANAKGDGKLFSCTLMDETGEIKATAFNQAVDELYNRLEEGKVYYISRGRVNLAKKKFSHLSNEYELSLERTTEIEEVREIITYHMGTNWLFQCRDPVDVPSVKYNFIPLKDLENLPKDTICGMLCQ